MVRQRRTTALAVALGCWFYGAAAQYDSCINGTVADIGNGRCDAALNVPSCGFDGGDCCPCTCSDGPTYSCSDSDVDCIFPSCDDPPTTIEAPTYCEEAWIGDGWCDWENNDIECSWDGGDCCEGSCIDGPEYSCGILGFPCLDPAYSFDPEIVAEYPDCTGAWGTMGDGVCDAWNNNELCGYDGGDCCLCTCSVVVCDFATDFDNCLDPTAHDQLHECKATPIAMPCSPEVQQTWTVENSEQAQALAAAVNCSGGSFEVEWRGRIVLDESIYVIDGTVLTINGADSGAMIDGNATTRLFTVVGAALHLSNVSLTSGASLSGGAIAAAGSVLTLDRTNFIGNSATWFGGAIVVSDGSNLSCTGGGAFTYNQAGVSGGAMIVTGGSTALCGSLWMNNAAGKHGGALAVEAGSSVSWKDDAAFELNTVYFSYLCYGGAMIVTGGSNVSWAGATSFVSNTACTGGGALAAFDGSEVSWTGATSFVDNFANGYGGAVTLFNGSSISWTGTTEFRSNIVILDGGAVGISALGTDDIPKSTLVINGPTTFLNNTGGADGGALAIRQWLSVEIGAVNITFTQNSAGVSGGAVFISGVEVGPAFAGVTFSSNIAKFGGAVYSLASGNAPTGDLVIGLFVGDQTGLFSGDLSLVTKFISCHFIHNRATTRGGAIESSGGRDLILDSVFEGNAAGTGGALSLLGSTYLQNCSFVDNESDSGGGPAVSNSGDLTQYDLSFRGNVFKCDPGMFLSFNETEDNYAAFRVVCSGCRSLCTSCSFEEPQVEPTCTRVLDHTSSPGGTVTLAQIRIDPGYWRATESTTNVLACYNADACLGGVTGTAGYCREGSKGPYCSICSDGYTAELGFSCTKCSDSAGGIALAAVLLVVSLVLAAAVFSYMLSGKGVGMGRGVVDRLGRYIPLTSVKIVVVAWQILTQFSSVANVAYPEVYQRLVNALGAINFDLTWILSATCVVDVDFHDRLLVVTLGPIAALIFLAVTYSIAARINRGDTDALRIVWNKHVSMVLLLAFLIYSSVSSVLFMTFACEGLDDRKTYLRADYRIECDSAKHEALQVYAGFMLVFYTAGIPLFYGVLLFRDWKILRHQDGREENERLSSTFQLWKPYKPSRFYYEVIECGRRVLLAGVVVFIYPNTTAQITISLLMAFFFVVMSEALAPYASKWDTWLNRIGHGVVFVSMFGALLLKVDVSNERAGGRDIFEGLLVAAHACLIFVIVAETFVLACGNFRESRAFGDVLGMVS